MRFGQRARLRGGGPVMLIVDIAGAGVVCCAWRDCAGVHETWVHTCHLVPA